MRKILLTLVAVAAAHLCCHAAVTLDHCLEQARANYPLIQKYGLVEKTTALSLSDINKSWLPRISVYGQATVQNVVPEFPETFSTILAGMGQQMKGLSKEQYKVGVDVTQTIWDGGASRAQRQVERASATEQQASLEVQMYAVRAKVMDLYFGILLIDEQIAQTENTIALLQANHELLQSMVAGGVAMQSDADMVEAQQLATGQQLVAARSAAASYRAVLSVYTGENLAEAELVRPAATIPSDLMPQRPEQHLFDARASLNAARDESVESSVMPRVGAFAQAYYGYPGINYFESMMNRNLSFNIVAGVKLTWNIDSFYTKKNSLRKLRLANDGVNADRDVFLFNTRLQTAAQTEEIDGLRAVMADDSRIVELRGGVRKAAESQLRNGVIDATALLSKITDENQARLTAAYHEIQLIQSIYNLRNTLNR